MNTIPSRDQITALVAQASRNVTQIRQLANTVSEQNGVTPALRRGLEAADLLTALGYHWCPTCGWIKTTCDHESDPE